MSSSALKSLKSKVSDSLSEWVSEWQGHLLSCPGQLKIRKSELFQWHTNRKIKLSVPGGARLNHGNARTCSRRLMTIEHIAAISTRLLVVTTFKRMRMYFNRSCNITNIKERPTGKHINANNTANISQPHSVCVERENCGGSPIFWQDSALKIEN